MTDVELLLLHSINSSIPRLFFKRLLLFYHICYKDLYKWIPRLFELCKYFKWFKSFENLKPQNLGFKIDTILHKDYFKSQSNLQEDIQ